MITGILASGFGHSVRFIAAVEHLRKYSDEAITCLAPKSMINFIQSNLKPYNCQVINSYYLPYLIKKLKKKNTFYIKKSDRAIIKNLKESSILVNDFILNINKIKEIFNPKTISCCIYHGDLHIKKSDSKKIASFKQAVCKAASQHDLFFHINLTEPLASPKLNCLYIPVPIITRQITMKKSDVKKILGLSAEEKFILVHAGSAVMENRYKDLNLLYQIINRLKCDYPIVMAGSLDHKSFSFSPNIIKAPLFLNGLNLVNASELVISKPGMGILQDCIACRKPLLFLPADFAERDLKIQLLDQLLDGQLPKIKDITLSELQSGIERCLNMKELYYNSYAKVPCNGAEILAQALKVLSGMEKKEIHKIIPLLKNINPFL